MENSKKYIFWLFVVIFAYGCSSVSIPEFYEMTILNTNTKTKVFINSDYAGTGDTVKTKVSNSEKALQIRFEADSCKTEYGILFRDDGWQWHILSWIPKSLFKILRNPFETSANDSSYEYRGVKPYIYWSPEKKRIYVDNIFINVRKNKNLLNLYTFDDLVYGRNPLFRGRMDSIKLVDSELIEHLEKKLVQLNFIDTANTVFIDNTNTLVLNCEVNKIVFNGIVGNDNNNTETGEETTPFFINCEIKGTWCIMNILEDTLLTVPFRNYSGTIFIDKKKDKDYGGLIFNDALENSFLNLINLTEMEKLIKKDTILPHNFNLLTIPNPLKTPGNIDEAIKSSFTIKGEKGHGSGFLISGNGYLITNYHVINNQNNLKAINNDGSEYNISVVRTDKDADLALLKIDGNFEFAFKIPDKNNFAIGQEVFAIGTPESVELSQSISKGVISGIRSDNNKSFIQTDISVNRGNSGGAVVSSKGELIGVVEFKLFGLGIEGISFSIPAYSIMKSLSLSYGL